MFFGSVRRILKQCGISPRASTERPQQRDQLICKNHFCRKISQDESVRGWEERVDGNWIPATGVKISDLVNDKSVVLKFGDSPKRTWWRTKQNLDYTFLMWYASNMSDYYMQLEDDVHPVPKFAQFVRSGLERSLIGKPWVMATFSSLGFIGKLFNSSHLPSLASFLLTFSPLSRNL